MAVIALDLGGTKLAGALVDDCSHLVYRVQVPLAGRSGTRAGNLIDQVLTELLGIACGEQQQVHAVGISVPGICNQRNGTVWAPNIRGWTQFPLRRQIKQLLGRKAFVDVTTAGSATPVIIDNDRACSVLGETWRGKARGCTNVIFLAVGTGIGAGILVDGRVLRGAHDSAGSIGWLALDRPFRQQYVACGCFEHHASGAGLVKVARGMMRRGDSGDRLGSAAEIFADYRRGNSIAKRVLDDAVQFWGMAVANLVSLFNPELIVFGGGVFGPAARLLPAIRREATKWAQPLAMRQVKLSVSSLGNDAALYGAAYLARSYCGGGLNSGTAR